MIRHLKFAVFLSLALTAATACAQVATAANSPVAYVYVAGANGSSNEIVAYSAAANGKLSPVTGSPFPDNVTFMAANGKYLMAANAAKPDIDSYKIASDGALTFASSINYQKHDFGCGYAGPVFFDLTGATLYVMEYDGSNACANTVYASYAVAPATGGLKYLGTDNTGVFPGSYYAASFIKNDVYGYTAEDDSCMYYAFYGFKRKTNGLLTSFNVKANYPPPPAGVRAYVPNMSAADATNHLAITMQPANPPGCASGPFQLASYTAEANGNLTTTNTYKNMPATVIANSSDMKISPSGKLLALAGGEGLQIFHFNGASPITHYTGLLTTDPIDQMFWDNNNHLYAISHTTNKLYVFTVTPTGHQQAPGSPYAVSSPSDIVVQPLSH